MEKNLLWFLLHWLLAGILLVTVNVSVMLGTSKENEASAANGIAAECVTAAEKALTVLRSEWEGAMDEIEISLRESLPASDVNRRLIEISGQDGTEQDLPELVYNRMEAYEAEGGRYIQGQINLSFDGLVLASVECGDEYQVLIAFGEKIYRICSAHSYSRDDWYQMIRKTLDEVFEEQNLRRDLTEDFFRENLAQEEECSCLMVLWYRGICCEFRPDLGQRLLSWQKQPYGISFQESYYFNSARASAERTLALERVEDLGGTKSHNVLRRRLQELYPDLETCYIWWPYVKQDASLAVAWLPGKEKIGFYSTTAAWQREVYRISCTDRTGENPEAGIERLLWEDTAQINYYWTNDESAVLRESDEARGCYAYRKDIGVGEPYTIVIKRSGEQESDESPEGYCMTLYREVEGEERIFQELVLEEELRSGMELCFDDLNGDGYEDILLGGSYKERCYVWSPSQKLYVDVTAALGGTFWFWVLDRENRQLWILRRGFNREKEDLYQWSGESDCRLLKEFYSEYTYTGEGSEWREIVITVHEDETDKVLSDYVYSYQEYSARSPELWYVFLLDFVWEREVAVSGETESCILRYAQDKDSGEDGTVLYTDRWFLFRGDTYLIGSYSGATASSPWKEISMDDEGGLRVIYEDGSSNVYGREVFE
ncbi:MAG: hypothetical protein NC123_11650 [Butyrivibrio sp.]|nr:hypothetical protein [Butyrivibrio sp.]